LKKYPLILKEHNEQKELKEYVNRKNLPSLENLVKIKI